MHTHVRSIAASILIALVASLLPLALAQPAAAARVKTIKIADASIVEGNAGQQSMSFRVTWSGAKGGGPVSALYAAADGTATAGSDYTAKSGTVTMSNSCRCGTISVPILGDTMTEGTETFTLELSSPTNATIGDAQAIGTIYDNEGPPAVVVLDGSADESAGSISFDLVMMSSSLTTQTVDYATGDQTATAGTDYTGTAGTISFLSG